MAISAGNPGGNIEILPIPSGNPTVTIDISKAKLRQNTDDYHLEINGIVVSNTTNYPIFLAYEIRLFQGAQATCPASGQVFIGMDRNIITDPNTGSQTIGAARIHRITPEKPTQSANIDVYQPSSIQGMHSVCIYIHGTWKRDLLETEISGISG